MIRKSEARVDGQEVSFNRHWNAARRDEVQNAVLERVRAETVRDGAQYLVLEDVAVTDSVGGVLMRQMWVTSRFAA